MTPHTDILRQAWELRGEGEYGEVIKLLDELIQKVADDDFLVLGRISHIRMQVHSDLGRTAKAIEQCKETLGLYEKADDPNLIAHSQRHLADLQTETGDLDAAIVNYQAAIRIYRAMNKPLNPNLANALRGYALLRERQGEDATNIWIEIRDIYAYHEISEGVSEAEDHL